MQHLQKTGGAGGLWLTSNLLTLAFGRSDDRTWQRFNFIRPLFKECFTTLLHSHGSTLFLETAGVYPYNSHSGIPLRVSARDCAPLPLPFPPRCILFVSRPTAWFSFGPPGPSTAGMANYDSGATHPQLPPTCLLPRS